MWLANPSSRLSSLRGCRVLAVLVVGGGTVTGGKAFGHDDFGAASTPGHDVEFIHEGAHQEDAAAGSAQEIFLGKGIGHLGKVETLLLVQNPNDLFFRSEIHGQMNLFVGAFLIAVVEGVDDTLAHGHADAVTVVFAEARGFRDSQAHLFGNVDALYLRLQRDFQVLGLRSHATKITNVPIGSLLCALWVTHREKASQWSRATSPRLKAKLDPVRPVQSSILDGLTEMPGVRCCRLHPGLRSCALPSKMRSWARAESPSRVMAFSSNFSPSSVNGAILANHARRHLRVRVGGFVPLVAQRLATSRLNYATTHRRRIL